MAHSDQKEDPVHPLREMFTELYRVIQQSIAQSWLVRVSLAVTLLLPLAFVLTKFINVLTTSGFGPHGACLLWIPSLIMLYVSADTLIGFAYFTISAVLIYFVSQTYRIVPFQWIFVTFGVFIIACGATHFLDVWTLWVPMYWLAGTMKLLAAIASVTTALALPIHLPKVLRLIHQASVSEQRQRLNEELTHVNQTQRNFVAIVSHEFRTALSSIKGFSELIRDDEELSGSEIKEFADNISTEAMRLNRMITDLLDLERMKSGTMQLAYEPLDLNSLVQEVAEHFRPTTAQHTIALQLSTIPTECMGDMDKLKQVVSNLLNNAMKYWPNGGEIVVGSTLEGQSIQVWVQDHGVGIPSASLEVVFLPYSRIAENTRYIKGTGLGLSIARQIVQMHGGEIWVESEVGQGSCFRFRLPCTIVQNEAV
ncbi:MAG: HAMP domain-containing histidine kinase [Chloroflexi bacterium]|nr:MAG: HAMP domain-containing histidine kinase [Chloroflexota bacterium]